MERNHIGNQLNGRAIGSIFFAGFGALWLTLAAAAKQAFTVDIVIGIATVFAALVVAGFWLLNQSKNYPKAVEDPQHSRQFNRINIAQWIAISIVAYAFSRVHLDAYIPAVVTVIVGIHLFPLAKLFRYPMHNLTGVALVLWGSASVLAISKENLQGTTALGTGIILWVSAALTLALASRVALRTDAARNASSRGIRV
jgi:hypothetical protein